MSVKSEIAVSKFLDGFNCAQSVLFSFCGDLKISKKTALKLACGFGAGMGRKQEVCGAVSGGIMAIGMKFGRTKKDDKTSGETTYGKVREFMDAFAGKHGTCICGKLLPGCVLATEEGHKLFVEKDYRNTRCVPCVRSAVEMAEETLKTD